MYMKKEKDVAVFDVPGAYYLHGQMPPEHRVTLRIKGHFVDIMCHINSDYEQFLWLILGKEKQCYTWKH